MKSVIFTCLAVCFVVFLVQAEAKPDSELMTSMQEMLTPFGGIAGFMHGITYIIGLFQRFFETFVDIIRGGGSAAQAFSQGLQLFTSMMAS